LCRSVLAGLAIEVASPTVKPWITLASARGPDGKELVLQSRDGVYVIRVGGLELMSSAKHGSEAAMAEAGLKRPLGTWPRVLLGGLGLGYTLRATLDRLPTSATVVVAELSEAVVSWNRGLLASLAGAPLTDARVVVEVVDVAKHLQDGPEPYDAILLDVDNGPSALSQKSNQRLYETQMLTCLHGALRPGGALVVWSAGPDARFLERLSKVGFEAGVQDVPARRGGGGRHTLFLGRKNPGTAPPRVRRGR
jgi:spermidine synthase